jgi:hypothetical protein
LGIRPVRPREDHPLLRAGAIEAIDRSLFYPQQEQIFGDFILHRSMGPPKNYSLANF